jgi:hypothetical protein
MIPSITPPTSAPVHFGAHQRVGITASLVKNGPPFGLFYNKDEFQDDMGRHNKEPSNPLPLTAKVKSYLFSMTNRYLGAVDSMADFLKEV